MGREDDPFTWTVRRGVAVVRATGEIDLSTADRLRACCEEALDTIAADVRPGPRPRVVVDLAETKFLDSSALAVLVSVAKQVDAEDGWLRLAAASHPVVRKVLEITQLDVALGDFPTVEDAIEA